MGAKREASDEKINSDSASSYEDEDDDSDKLGARTDHMKMLQAPLNGSHRPSDDGGSHNVPFVRERSFSVSSGVDVGGRPEETRSSTSQRTAAAGVSEVRLRNADESDGGVKGAITNVLSNSLEKLRKILGLTPNCLNGGTKTMRGECVCQKHYEGKLCEDIICVNNGTKVEKHNVVPLEYQCKCDPPEFISGTHCEVLKCMNGGTPLANGECKCLDYWYEGRFCENYTSSWGVLVAPVVCIVIIVVCCLVCRLDLCPRKTTTQARRRRRAAAGGVASSQTRVMTRGVSDNSGSCLRLQENLLNEQRSAARPPELPSYVIRLDSIPAFNPRGVGLSAGDGKPMDPPPSYDQVVAASSTRAPQGHAGNSRPPEYSPHDSSQPPPPRFRPPMTPGTLE